MKRKAQAGSNGSSCRCFSVLAMASFFVFGLMGSAQADRVSTEAEERAPGQRHVHRSHQSLQGLDRTGIGGRGSGSVLWDNGGMVTHPGAGAGGLDVSMASVVPPSAGSNVQASGASHFRIADDFTVDTRWRIDQIVTHAYETGAFPPTWTSFNMNIWDGRPGDPGSTIIDTFTASTNDVSDAGIYRVFNGAANLGNTQRRINRISFDLDGLILEAGTYWIDWQVVGGTSAWAPQVMLENPSEPNLPITVPGNARQLRPLSPEPGGWQDVLVDSWDNGAEMPFLVIGEELAGSDHCDDLESVVGTWETNEVLCGNFDSTATSVTYESARLAFDEIPLVADIADFGYTYEVDFIINRPNQPTAASGILVNGNSSSTFGNAQIWDQAIAFAITADGRYSIFRFNSNSVQALQPWTNTAAGIINGPGELNTLSVVSTVAQLVFSINGEVVQTLANPTPTGEFGMGFVRSIPTGQPGDDDWMSIEDIRLEEGFPVGWDASRTLDQLVSPTQHRLNREAQQLGSRDEPWFASRAAAKAPGGR